MYSLIFAFFYHLNSRGKGDDPRGVANMVLSLFQFLHFFTILSVVLYFIGMTRDDFSQISGASPAIYGIISLLPFYVFNLIYFKGLRLEQILYKFDQSRTMKIKNILFVTTVFILPIVFLALTEDLRHK